MEIVLTGPGGVVISIAAALVSHVSISLCDIYSRQLTHTEALRKCFVLTYPTTDSLRWPLLADPYVIAVSDQVVAEVITAPPSLDGLVVHTSAATPTDYLSGQRTYGVWYPFNSFTKEVVVPLEGQEVLYQSALDEGLTTLRQWNELLQVEAIPPTLDQWLWLHLTGVLASNCINRLYTLSHCLLTQTGLLTDLLHGLILRTASKAITIDPYVAQTGLARRHDLRTIARHRVLLEQLPESQQEVSQLCNLFTEVILDDYLL